MANETFPKVGDTVYVRNEYGYYCGKVVAQGDELRKRTTIYGTEDKILFEVEKPLCMGKTARVLEVCFPERVNKTFFSSEEAVMLEIERELEPLRAITASRYIDKNLVRKYQEKFFWLGNLQDQLKDLENRLLGLLQDQFAVPGLENLYNTYGEKHCVDFLNRAVSFYVQQKETHAFIAGSPYISELPPKTMEEFTRFAFEREIPGFTEPMTIRRYLAMCRVVYDAIGVSAKYHPGASDVFVYCRERLLSFEHDFEGFPSKDWDSPEVFHSFYSLSRYHIEELQFGGMRIWLRDVPGGWLGDFSVSGHPCGPNHAQQAILAYIALRRNGYPITCIRPEELLKEARAIQ